MSRLTLSLVRPSSEEEWSKETADGYRKHAYRTFKLPIFLLVTTATFTCLVGMFIGATYLATPVSSDSCRRFGISTLSSCSTQDTHSHESALEQPHLIFPPSQELLSPQNGFKTFNTERFNGSATGISPYKRPPNHELELLWADYWPVTAFSITTKQYHETNPQHQESGVQLHPGSEEPHYIGTFAAMHQMHCLYNLFKATNLEYYEEEKGELERNPGRWHEMVDHCVDILRQKIECDRDTSVITYNWVKHKRGPVANFNVERQCRPWQEMEDWAREHEVKKMPSKLEGVVEMDGFP